MHEYWLQFFTAALGVYGKGEAAAKAADEACAIYDARVSEARSRAADESASRVSMLKALGDLVFDTLPSIAPGMTVEQIRVAIDGDFDSVSASITRLTNCKRIYQCANPGAPMSFYRKAV